MGKILILLITYIASSTAYAATPASVGCTYDQYGRTADGSALWTTTTQAIPAGQNPPFETNCLIDQFSYNNFYYLVSDDGKGNPKFMSMLPWYGLFPAQGAPVWVGSYSPLKATQLNKAKNETEAGDGFQLLDVNNQTSSYDIRVNQPFYNYVNSNKLYQQSVMNQQAAAFSQNSAANGIWLPPTQISDKSLGAIEIKTAWRNFGTDAKLCPGDIMHCEVDDNNNTWGLVGFHLVQKTNTHGELVWASFEHIANSPDCTPDGSNSIGQFPADPVNIGKTINVNKNYPSGVQNSGWNYFDFGSYTKAGGDGKSCAIPTQKGSPNPICLTSPVGAAPNTWQRVEVCRTDVLATLKNGCVALNTNEPNSQDIACLNDSLVKNFPAGLASKWKYYKLVGMEWAANGNTEGGGFPLGCFTLDGTGESGQCPKYKGGGESGGAPQYRRAGSTTMANTTMETWMQNGISLTVGKNTYTQTDCFGCHQPQTLAFPSKTGTFNQGDMSHIFSRIQQQ